MARCSRQREWKITDLLAGFHAKIGRAKEHLEALKVAVAPYVGEGTAYAISKEVSREKGEYLFRLHIKEAPPLVQWSVIIGDCFQNSRSALDHLYWALVLKNNPNKRIKGKANTNFPIIRDASTFKGRKIYIESLVGIKALAMLESLQPFNDSRGWEKNALMFLHDQNNVDKHQLLVPAIAVLNAGRFSSETVGGRDVRFVAKASLMEVGDGAEIVQCVATPPEDVVDLNYVASFDLVFKGKPGPVLVVPSLENIIGAVERIGAKFATLL